MKINTGIPSNNLIYRTTGIEAFELGSVLGICREASRLHNVVYSVEIGSVLRNILNLRNNKVAVKKTFCIKMQNTLTL